MEEPSSLVDQLHPESSEDIDTEEHLEDVMELPQQDTGVSQSSAAETDLATESESEPEPQPRTAIKREASDTPLAELLEKNNQTTAPATQATAATAAHHIQVQEHATDQTAPEAAGETGKKRRRVAPSQCPYCIGTYVNLDLHIRTHATEKPFACTYPGCNHASTQYRNLRKHMIKTHKALPCPQSRCGSVFFDADELETHLGTHREKPFACTYADCDYAAAVRGDLKQHRRKHYAHPCPRRGCSSMFNDPAELQTHILTHTSEKPFACRYPGCGYAASQSGNLRTHMIAQHKAHACSHYRCTFVSFDSVELETHMGTHAEEKEKAFACTYLGCDFATTKGEFLRGHMERRHGALACPHYRCISIFNDQAELETHMATHKQ
ncbi:hypothetical protein GE09DRAFT_742103 [Coniochaeta sp. 2T2.1]|nr:hypothetical protein GE09DRAFT_742103 [Coniochaeta sp. 2T2.1]